MEFPEEYFKDEEIDGFLVSEMMKRAWAAQIEEYLELKKLCDSLGLRMYADYGTLLGAVRHHGFVPWDDDLDVSMPRPDYRKLMDLIVQGKLSLPKGYEFITIYNHTDYSNIVSRFMGAVTIDTRAERMERFHGFPYPSGIDIFPLDYIPRDPGELEMWKNLVTLVSATQNAMRDGTADEAQLAEILPFIEQTCGVHFKSDEEEPLVHQMALLTDKIYGLYTEKDADVMGTAHLQSEREHDFVPKEDLESFVELPFENITVTAPEHYHDYLVMRYGPQYMTPVRMELHDYPFYRREEALLTEFLQTHEVGEEGIEIKFSGIAG